jgi:uncharacterized protein YjaG (DUF416 family)
MTLDNQEQQKFHYETFKKNINDIFTSKWKLLNGKQKEFFLLLSAERAFPFYYEFTEMSKFGKVTEVRKILNSLWAVVLEDKINNSIIQKLQKRLLKPTICPHTDEQADCSSALDFCSILWETMEYIITKDETHFQNVHTTMIYSLIEKEILYHTGWIGMDYSQLLSQPLMKAEIEIQLLHINLLINRGVLAL